MSYLPDTNDALADLQELKALCAQHQDLAVLVRDALVMGTPGLEVDGVPAVTAGDFVFRYKLPEQLQVLLTAGRMRARKLDADCSKGGSHSESPPALLRTGA